MYAYAAWNIGTSQILSRRELALWRPKKRSARLPNVQMNLAIVRLACCCGLRASEIGGLKLNDVRVGINRPHIMVRADFAKLGCPHRVPLLWGWRRAGGSHCLAPTPSPTRARSDDTQTSD